VMVNCMKSQMLPGMGIWGKLHKPLSKCLKSCIENHYKVKAAKNCEQKGTVSRKV
jgi:hypothetical protein